MKLKGYTGTKYCNDGEAYRFKNGVAIVPGFWRKGFCKPITITLKEFKEINNEYQKD